MPAYVLEFEEVGRDSVAEVGGKGAALGALSRLPEAAVPPGFCVSTAAFARVVGSSAELAGILAGIARMNGADRDAIRSAAAEARAVVARLPLPDDLRAALAERVARGGATTAWAVRSSATAEDLGGASFAGQHDSFLGVVGVEAVVAHVQRCWASLYTERAVAYRLHRGFSPDSVQMAVVVQALVAADAAGVLFTADPVSSNRRVSYVEAVLGLGEALLSGHVSADAYRVRDGQILEERLATQRPALTRAQVLRLERLGRRIEAYFGAPQDLEWCWRGDDVHVVQSRPITTLYPVPDAGLPGNRVFVSVGHGQMMTDAMKPLGWSLFQESAGRPMYEAGGRLFVDVTAQLGTPGGRAAVLGLLGRNDPLIRDALTTILARGDFVPQALGGPPPGPAPAAPAPPPAIDDDPALVAALVADSEAALAATRAALAGKTGVSLVDGVLHDLDALKRHLAEPQRLRALFAGMNAAAWLDDTLEAWLGEPGAADALSRSAPNNVTSEMGLALLDVADAIRPYPAVVAYLRDARDEGFWDGLAAVAGGGPARDALAAFLDRYGMRCSGEIDVTRPRWTERPTTLVAVLLGHVRDFAPGESARRFARGLADAAEAERSVLARVRALPDGEAKADEVARAIRRLRAFIGFREYPKYHIVGRFFAYKQALLGAFGASDDLDYLTLAELRAAAAAGAWDAALIARRREEHARNAQLAPPRVLTSEGEVVAGAYRREGLPADALVGLAVSAGVVEGRARVVLDLAEADLQPGDILVTPFTDPSWTPRFVGLGGLVTEVGGLMSHGAVIAREYGLPAVVGVERATARIRDGQRVRVDGAAGFVALL